MNDHAACCAHSAKPKRSWKQDPLTWLVLLTVSLILLSYRFSALEPFRHSMKLYFRMMVGPVAVGLLLGGLVDRFVPKEYISKLLAGSRKRTVLYATGLGFLMSACNHGILALSMELHKKGASGPAVVSFLLASPWANLPMTFLLVGFFGWKGLLIILTALWIALVTGWIFQKLEKQKWIEINPHAVQIADGYSIRADLFKRMKAYTFSFSRLAADTAAVIKGIWELSQMILLWILIGALLASLAGAYVPPHIFHRFLGPSLTGLAVTLAVSAVLEVCSEGTSPLAFEIYRQTGAFGNAFAFLMGGVVTDYTEIGLLWNNLGRRTALWTLAVTVPQVIFFGWIFNQVFR